MAELSAKAESFVDKLAFINSNLANHMGNAKEQTLEQITDFHQ